MYKFVRGDSFPFKKKITYKDGSPIIKSDIETLIITCRQLPSQEYPILFQKTLKDVTIDAEGYCHIVFEPKDTEFLSYGEYYFDIEITLKSGYRKTSLEKFEITEETTINGGK